MASDLLDGIVAPRQATSTLEGLYFASDHSRELAGFSAIVDWYDIVDQSTVAGAETDVDAAVVESARALLAGALAEPRSPADVCLRGEATRVAEVPAPATRLSRMLRRLRRR